MHRFLRYSAEKQTVTQTNDGKNPSSTTALGEGNNLRKAWKHCAAVRKQQWKQQQNDDDDCRVMVMAKYTWLMLFSNACPTFSSEAVYYGRVTIVVPHNPVALKLIILCSLYFFAAHACSVGIGLYLFHSRPTETDSVLYCAGSDQVPRNWSPRIAERTLPCLLEAVQQCGSYLHRDST